MVSSRLSVRAEGRSQVGQGKDQDGVCAKRSPDEQMRRSHGSCGSSRKVGVCQFDLIKLTCHISPLFKRHHQLIVPPSI